ncbi:sodium/glutamate symporter [Collimonas sp. H4R21]|jgi:Na+/glutamate symporter|uniref:Sodium/glutamate symporter n=1 Tax=Collimonas rhizosphaerae TaxID=3126357 RepID=A0ABU9PSI9_9BURK|nr:sodium/glutamate symporter [Collimonas sp. OK412]
MSLRLWNLASLALPVLLILAVRDRLGQGRTSL